MRVLFVTHDNVSHEPLGLEFVSGALLSAGHETKACQQSKAVETSLRWLPDFVAFQVITGDQDRWGGVAREIKSVLPSVKTIFGGPHFLFFTGARQAEADIIIRGEAEQAVLQAVSGSPWQDLQAVESLDLLSHPDRGLLYNDDFPAIKSNVIRNFMACRGCPYKCTYCYNSNKQWLKMVEGKNRIRYHSPEWLIDDIKRTFVEFGGELVSFQDDIFGIDMKWLEKFVASYRKIRIPFFAQLRPHLINEDRVKLLKEAGVHIISFAIESGNEHTRQEILDRRESNELIERGCRILHKHGIKFRMQNLLGLPVQDPLADALETLRFNMKMRPTLSWCSLLQAYPGTEIANYVVRKGIVPSMEALVPMVNSTFFEESSLPLPGKVKIERLHKYWSAVVRWPWLYPLVANVLINVDLGPRAHSAIFEKSKQYINKREYWRVEGKHHVTVSREQLLDRLGGELNRTKPVVVNGQDVAEVCQT